MIGYEVNRGRRGIRRGEVLRYSAATGKAFVTLDGSLAAVELPVAAGLMTAPTPGARVAVMLFDENNPADGLIVGLLGTAYQFSRRTWQANEFASHRAGFEDSQATPYSFGSAPGGFSLTLGANRTADSNVARSWLRLINSDAAGVCYLQWTDATAMTRIRALAAVEPLPGGTDKLVAELRVWDTQTPGAGSAYWAMRWRWMGSTYPAYPFRVGLWYGTGTTLSLTDGTLAVGEGQAISGQAVRCEMTTTAAPACFGRLDLAEGFGLFSSSATVAGYPAGIRLARLHLFPQYQVLYVDEVVMS